MNIEGLTISQAKEIASIFHRVQKNETFLEIGKSYLFRTVTYFYTGTVSSINSAEVELTNAAWIADTGRFSDALNTGDFSEVEPYPEKCFLRLDSIVDYSPWKHDLPTKQK